MGSLGWARDLADTMTTRAGETANTAPTTPTATTVTRIGAGLYRVEIDGRAERVFVAGPAGDRWASWDGRVFREAEATPPARPAARGESRQSLTAPMPASVIKVLVEPGASVRKGDTLVILEAMKMELPLRASSDATVAAVNCRAGELVHADAVLVELV